MDLLYHRPVIVPSRCLFRRLARRFLGRLVAFALVGLVVVAFAVAHVACGARLVEEVADFEDELRRLLRRLEEARRVGIGVHVVEGVLQDFALRLHRHVVRFLGLAAAPLFLQRAILVVQLLYLSDISVELERRNIFRVFLLLDVFQETVHDGNLFLDGLLVNPLVRRNDDFQLLGIFHQSELQTLQR